MTNRREILRAAAALPLVTAATGVVVVPRIAVHSVLIDERHAEARRFRAHVADRGARVHTIPNGDITQIWVRQIGPVWRRARVAMAGLTERPALFCLEEFALACGLRVVFHNEHVLHASAPVEHRLLRGARVANLTVGELADAGPLWPVRIADAMATHCESGSSRRFGRSDAAFEPALAPGAQLLTSWIIASA